MSDEARQEFALHLTSSSAAKLKSAGLLALVVPVVCHTEAPEGCGFHVVEFQTAGIDLGAVSVLQLLNVPSQCSTSNIFGFTVALHLDNKPKVRIVLGYTCEPKDLLVPVTRWVLRTPKEAIIVLAPPSAPRENKASEALICSGDVQELCPTTCAGTENTGEEEADPEESDVVDIADESVGKRLQLVLERLWYEELSMRQLQPEKGDRNPGKLAQSISMQHYVTATGRVVCDRVSVFRGPKWEGAMPKGEVLLPLANSWAELEMQLRALVARECLRSPLSTTAATDKLTSSKASRKKKKNKKKAQGQELQNGREAKDILPKQQQLGVCHGDELEEEDIENEDEHGEKVTAVQHYGLGLKDEHEDEDEDADGEDKLLEQEEEPEELREEEEPEELREEEEEEASVQSGRATPGSSPDSSIAGDYPSNQETSIASEFHVEFSTPGSSQAPSEFSTDLLEAASSSSRPTQTLPRGKRTGIGSSSDHSRLSGGLKRIHSTRSWADMSENPDDDDDDVGFLFFGAQHLRSQVGVRLEQSEREQEHTWRGVGAALEELPDKVMDALTGAIAQVTAEDLCIPEQKVDVPAGQRCWSTDPDKKVESADSFGLLSQLSKPWVSPISELGEWYELRRPVPGLICGVVLTGDKESNAWVEMVKLKTLGEDGCWSDVVNGGVLFQGCRNAEEKITVSFESVFAIAVRIYPVLWHGCIALRAALVEPKQDGISIGAEASNILRKDADKALAGMMSHELNKVRTLSQSLGEHGRSSANISELVSTLCGIPNKVADAATRLESSVVKAWKEKAKADDALQQARQWVESIPEHQPLAMAARAQAAAMDQVTEALMVLEELHLVTASSVADSVLRAKYVGASTPSDTESRQRLHAGLQRGMSSAASPKNVSQRTDASNSSMTFEAPFDLNVEIPQADPQKREFWLELFLNGHAFRVTGPTDSFIWEAEERAVHADINRGKHRVFSYMMAEQIGSNVVQTGQGEVGEIIQATNRIKDWTRVVVTIVLEGIKTSAILAPLRLGRHEGRMFRKTDAEVDQVIIALANDRSTRALSLKNGEVQLTESKESWETESLIRHWRVSPGDVGFRLRFGGEGELAAKGAWLVLTESGFDWQFRPVSEVPLAVHLVSGGGSLALLPGGLLEFTMDRSRFLVWHIIRQSHSSQNSKQSALHSYQMEPEDGVFHAAGQWRQGRDLKS